VQPPPRRSLRTAQLHRNRNRNPYLGSRPYSSLAKEAFAGVHHGVCDLVSGSGGSGGSQFSQVPRGTKRARLERSRRWSSRQPPWIAPPEIRELREVTRYRHKLVKARTSGISSLLISGLAGRDMPLG
jgi:hypothetical protein